MKSCNIPTHQNLVTLEPHADSPSISRGRTVLITGRHGQVDGGSQHGLYAYQTRMLSRYRYRVNGEAPLPAALSAVRQHSWLGYYYLAAPFVDPPRGDVDPTGDTLEMRVTRFIQGGMHEDIDFINHTGSPVSFLFEVELDSDFADLDEVGQGELKARPVDNQSDSREWRKNEEGCWELEYRCIAKNRFRHQGEEGERAIDRSLVVRVRKSDTKPSYRTNTVCFEIKLEARSHWHACFHFEFDIEGRRLESASCGQCHPQQWHDTKLLDQASSFSDGRPDISTVVLAALAQAKHDLEALRLEEGDHRTLIPIAGVPLYVALFGRDTLAASWQAALLTFLPMTEVLARLAALQGEKDSAWRDEEPDKMIHEAHTGPTNALAFEPHGSYYGALTTSTYFPRVLAELWSWSADRDTINELIQNALRCFRWLDRYSLKDGFYYYQSRSKDGLKNQGWKDSPNAIVYPDGQVVEDPIAPCEEQGNVYAAKMRMAGLLEDLGRKDEAETLRAEAAELQKRFNDRFWLEEEQFFALGLDSSGAPIASIASNAGHLLAAGILHGTRARAVADRLMADDLFSGWGVRTLSRDHPRFNPFSYHLGSVWPVEQAFISQGFSRYGLVDHLHTLVKAQFETCSLFRFNRLPETLSGHPRDEAHPFPAIYPRSNFPQAWSSSALFMHLQALIGLRADAPRHRLLVSPCLPDWFPHFELHGLRVGRARISLEFKRESDGATRWRVTHSEGDLRVEEEPRPQG